MATPLTAERIGQLVDTYCSAWGEPDVARRREILGTCYEDAAAYTDPKVHLRDADELVDHISRVLTQRPGARVVRTSIVDEHHGLVRFNWRVVAADGATLLEGIDFAEFSRNGLLQRIIGFVGVTIED